MAEGTGTGGKRVGEVSAAQRKSLAWEAFRAGVANGSGCASTRKSIRVAFERWWASSEQRRRAKEASEFDSFAELAIDILNGVK